MTPLFKRTLMAAVAIASWSAQAGNQHDFTYRPVAGVHEVKYFHGCYDHTDAEKRPKIDVFMAGLASTDVAIETRVRKEGKPSTEMITLRLKNMDVSFSVQFRSNDGPHCQQGVRSIVFSDKVLRGPGDLQ